MKKAIFKDILIIKPSSLYETKVKLKIFKLINILIFILILGQSSTYSQNSSPCWQHVSVGAFSTLAITYDGSLWGWGNNSFGQLGDGTTYGSAIPKKIGNSKDWAQISTHHHHTLAIKRDGSLWAWGTNINGELGDGSYNQSLIPKRIGTENNWKIVSAGGEHSLALKEDGSIWSWGRNHMGQLGIGSDINFNYPIRIECFSNYDDNFKWIDIDAGYSFNLAHWAGFRGTAGFVSELWGWGENGNAQCGSSSFPFIDSPKEIFEIKPSWTGASINAGFSHSLYNFDIEKLRSRGNNINGQLGIGTFSNFETGNSNIIYFPNNRNVGQWRHSIAAGDNHSLAIVYGFNEQYYKVYSWGGNDFGQLGIGQSQDISLPQEIKFNKTDFQPISVYSNSRHNAVLANSVMDWGNPNSWRADLWMWGNNNYGQIGDGSNTNRNKPVLVGCPVLSDVFDYELIPEIKIFPNPSSGIVNIESDGNFIVDILNSSGKKLGKSYTMQHFGNIELEPGIYFLKITTKNICKVNKVVITQ